MEIYVKIYLIAIFFCYSIMILIYVDFTHVAASITATDNVTN